MSTDSGYAMRTTYRGLLWHFTDIRTRGNVVAFWRIGDAEHIPWKRVPRHLLRVLQIPDMRRVSAHTGQKPTVRGDRHADVGPQLRRGDPTRTFAPTTYLRAGAGVVHHELSVGEVVGDDMGAVLGPLQRVRSVLDLERRTTCSQFPYLYANATCCKPRVVGGESRAPGISLPRFEYTDTVPVRGVPHLQAVRHVLPLERIRQQACVTTKVDNTETATDGGFVKRMFDPT